MVVGRTKAEWNAMSHTRFVACVAHVIGKGTQNENLAVKTVCLKSMGQSRRCLTKPCSNKAIFNFANSHIY